MRWWTLIALIALLVACVCWWMRRGPESGPTTVAAPTAEVQLPPVAHAAELATAAVLAAELAHPRASALEKEPEPESERTPVAAPETFETGGRIDLLSFAAPFPTLTLSWNHRSKPRLVEVVAESERWSGSFEPGEYELLEVRSAEGTWVIVEVALVSSDTRSCDLLLAPPGSRVLDVRRNDEALDRIRRGSVRIRPRGDAPTSMGAVHLTSRRRPEGGTERRVQFTDPAGLGVVQWSMDSISFPAVMPDFDPSTPLHIGAPGFEERTVDWVGAAGVTRVLLDPARNLDVELLGELAGNPRLAVRVAKPGAAAPFRIVDVRTPSSFSIDDYSGDEVEVAVFERTSAGLGAVMKSVVTRLDAGRATRIVVALSESDRTPCHDLDILVVQTQREDPPGRYRLRIIPVSGQTSVEDVFSSITPIALRGWRETSIGRECSTTIPNLQPGDYALILEPILLETRVQIGSISPPVLRLEIPQVSTLTIRPRRASGETPISTKEIGNLMWFVREPAAGSVAEHSNSSPLSDESFAVLLATGRAGFARMDETSWTVTAAVGATIETRYLGPQVLAAETLVVEMRPGAFEKSLTLRGL